MNVRDINMRSKWLLLIDVVGLADAPSVGGLDLDVLQSVREHHRTTFI